MFIPFFSRTDKALDLTTHLSMENLRNFNLCQYFYQLFFKWLLIVDIEGDDTPTSRNLFFGRIAVNTRKRVGAMAFNIISVSQCVFSALSTFAIGIVSKMKLSKREKNDAADVINAQSKQDRESVHINIEKNLNVAEHGEDIIDASPSTKARDFEPLGHGDGNGNTHSYVKSNLITPNKIETDGLFKEVGFDRLDVGSTFIAPQRMFGMAAVSSGTSSSGVPSSLDCSRPGVLCLYDSPMSVGSTCSTMEANKLATFDDSVVSSPMCSNTNTVVKADDRHEVDKMTGAVANFCAVSIGYDGPLSPTTVDHYNNQNYMRDLSTDCYDSKMNETFHLKKFDSSNAVNSSDNANCRGVGGANSNVKGLVENIEDYDRDDEIDEMLENGRALYDADVSRQDRWFRVANAQRRAAGENVQDGGEGLRAVWDNPRNDGDRQYLSLPTVVFPAVQPIALPLCARVGYNAVEIQEIVD